MSLLDQVVTLKHVLSGDPIWSEDKVMSLVGDRTLGTIRGMAQLDIAATHKISLLRRSTLVPESLLRRFGADCLSRPLARDSEAVAAERKWQTEHLLGMLASYSPA